MGHSQSILASSKEKPLKEGDRVILRVLEWGSERKDSVGEVVQWLGSIEDASIDNKAAIQEFELDESFPSVVIEEAKKFGTKVKASDLEGRGDFRDIECFTIDPETAKDFDDALSLSRTSEGGYHLGVHIADVSHYVQPGSFLDQEARKRCNSVYLPGTVLPMLPHELSSHLCSLKAEVNRLVATVWMDFDEKGTLLNYKIERGVIKSAKRFSYGEAKEILEGKKKSPHLDTLLRMVDLCHLLKNKRYERGSIEFCFPDIRVRLDEKGVPLGMDIEPYDITHQLVEEFMLKANEIVATHLSKQGKPLTYRIHDAPSSENMKEFVRLANSLGFNLHDQPSAEELQTFFDEVRSLPFGQFVATAFIRSMKLAVYSTQNVGHYGLGLEYYTHFTSPIRRYIDLIVHRLLFDHVNHEEALDDIALLCSEKERLSARAEGSVLHLKKLRYLQILQQQDPRRSYEALVTQIKPFGLVFELIEIPHEGFIPISELGNDYFVFDEKKRRLRGSRTHANYQAGDTISVFLRKVDLILQESRFELLAPQVKKQEPKKRGKRKR